MLEKETKKWKDTKTKEAVFDFLKFFYFFMFTLIYKIDKANIEWIQQTILCSTEIFSKSQSASGFQFYQPEFKFLKGRRVMWN